VTDRLEHIPEWVRLTEEKVFHGGTPLLAGMQRWAAAGEARSGPHAEPVEDGKIDLVDAVHVTGNDGRPDLRAVAVANVEEVLALMLVGADQ
jgi:hypothetical protein